MSRYIGPELRREVAARADFLCEYCLIAEEDTYFGCEVEHIISLKHGGSSVLDNLAYACAFCNRHKGSDIGSVSESGEFVRFFNPRTDHWWEHFWLEGLFKLHHGVFIRHRTEVGEVTARILQFNHSDRLLERETLCEALRYPSDEAWQRIKR